MRVCKLVYMLQEGKNLSVVFEEAYDGLVESGKFFIRLVTARIMGTATVKDIPSAVSTRIVRYAFFLGKAVYPHDQGTLTIVFGDACFLA